MLFDIFSSIVYLPCTSYYTYVFHHSLKYGKENKLKQQNKLNQMDCWWNRELKKTKISANT